MGSKSSAPSTPDYKGAAEATAAGNRVNQYTPWGSSTYQQTGTDAQGNPTYSQTIALSPTQQALMNAQDQTSLGLANLQGKGLGAVQNLFGNLPSQSQLPPNPINPGQTAQDAILARVVPQLNRQQDRMNNQLANQGIQVGSEAYSNAQKDFGQQANDAYSQAALQGIGVGQQARQQGMNEQGFYSQLPINLLNAIRTGSQVQSPTFGATSPGANYSQAAANQYNGALNAYNTQVGSQNSLMGGLFGLGSSILGSGIFNSDRRLKTDIVRISTHRLGIGVYEYTIRGKRQIGVMADEVEKTVPEAVGVDADGYKTVNYSLL